jgi:hypothetical protein
MPQYLLLLRDEGVRDWPDARREDVMARYGKWGDGLRSAGRFLGANKLKDGEGRVVRHEGSETIVMDGPYVETKEVLGGYFLIEADSYEHAIELSRDCPHYDYGSVEVREVEVLPRRG